MNEKVTVNLLLYNCLTPRPQSRRPLPEFRQVCFSFINPFVLRTDVRGVRCDAFFQPFHGALLFFCKLSCQRLKQICPQDCHLLFELILGLRL